MAHTGGTLRGHVLVVTFGGWTDGGEAATAVSRYLLDAGIPERVVNLDAQQFLDYQIARPVVERDQDGQRRVKFPTLDIVQLSEPLGSTQISNLSVLTGVEPSRNWIAFIGDVLEAAEALSVDYIVFIGAMLADIPHTRPVSVLMASEDKQLQHDLEITASDYEGPIGVFTAIEEAAREIGIPSLSIWGSVPHYAHNAPSPKVTLALLTKLVAITGITVDIEELQVEAKTWEQNVNLMVTDNDEMTDYITQLESARDTVESPEASGDAIAKEFEEYLRSTDDDADTDSNTDTDDDAEDGSAGPDADGSSPSN